MPERTVSPRASAVTFVVTTLVATAAAMGLFVLLDPRAQAYWAARIQAALTAVRGMLPF